VDVESRINNIKERKETELFVKILFHEPEEGFGGKITFPSKNTNTTCSVEKGGF